MKYEVGSVWFDHDGYFNIQATDVHVYFFHIQQLKSDLETGRMDWLWHLRQKNWFNSTVEKRLVSITKQLGVSLSLFEVEKYG